MDETRKLRIESTITHLISDMIMKAEIKDPRVHSLISITSVNAAPDLSMIRIQVSSLNGNTKEAVAGLNHASGYIQHRLAPRLKLRSIPRPVFFVDDSLRKGEALNRKMDEVLHKGHL